MLQVCRRHVAAVLWSSYRYAAGVSQVRGAESVVDERVSRVQGRDGRDAAVRRLGVRQPTRGEGVRGRQPAGRARHRRHRAADGARGQGQRTSRPHSRHHVRTTAHSRRREWNRAQVSYTQSVHDLLPVPDWV